jgi:hypothetical protein
MIYVFIFLLILTICSVYIAVMQYRRATFYEKRILEYHSIITDVQERLKQVDKLGSFESDDEVGFAFKAIQFLISEVEKYLQIENVDDGE